MIELETCLPALCYPVLHLVKLVREGERKLGKLVNVSNL